MRLTIAVQWINTHNHTISKTLYSFLNQRQITMIDKLSPFIRGFGQLIFMPHTGVGILVLLAIAINSPLMMMAGIIGGLGGTLVGQRAMAPHYYEQGLAGFNGVLLGLAATIFMQPSILLWLLVFVGGALNAYCFNWGLKRNLPIFTVPYIGVMILIWLLLPTLNHLDGGIQLHWPDAYIASAIITGVGQMGFQGNIISAGFILSGLYLGGGWRAIRWALIGSMCGALLGYLVGAEQKTMAVGLGGYNGALVAVALGVVDKHRLMNWQPWLGILVAVSLTLLGLHLAIIPVLTIPFVLAMWVVMIFDKFSRKVYQ